VQQY